VGHPGGVVDLPDVLVNTRTLVERQLALWPEHGDFLAKSFAERDARTMAITEVTATQVLALVDTRLDEYCRGYRWMCDEILEEELYFRRHRKYQAARFEDVFEAVYNNPRIMRLYMDGLLLSQVFWRNHVDVARFYEQYLASLPTGYRHLEIGPGHGLLLARAAMDPKCQTVAAWEISDASLASTRHCLERMRVSNPVTLEKRNICDVDVSTGTYDSVVVSEVLEHLEDPASAVAGVRTILSESGRAFINVPCNSPAPDHIYLFSEPDDLFAMLERAGFAILDRFVTPATGWTLERALRQKLTVSCAAVVSRDFRKC
jgi:SAM-dependent methyltransferase